MKNGYYSCKGLKMLLHGQSLLGIDLMYPSASLFSEYSFLVELQFLPP